MNLEKGKKKRPGEPVHTKTLFDTCNNSCLGSRFLVEASEVIVFF